MKITNKLCALAVGIILTTVGCQDLETEAIFTGAAISFESSSVIANEEGGAVTITAQLIGAALSSDVTVSYTVTESGLAEGVGYDYVGSSSLVIPAGEYTGSISIAPIDNTEISDGSQTLTFNITSVDASGVSIGTEGYSGRVATVTVLDDDFWCPRNQLTSITQGTDVGYSTREASIVAAGSPSDGCFTFTLVGGANSLFGSTIASFDITLIEDSPQSTTGIIENATGIALLLPDGTPVGGASPRTIDITDGAFGGVSVYDLEAGTMGFDYAYYNNGVLSFNGRFEFQ